MHGLVGQGNEKEENTPQLIWEWIRNMYKRRTVAYIQSNINTTGWDLVSKMCAGGRGGSCFYSRRTSKAYALRNRLAGGEILSHAVASLQRLFLLACAYTFPCSSNKLLFSHLDSRWGITSSVSPSQPLNQHSSPPLPCPYRVSCASHHIPLFSMVLVDHTCWMHFTVEPSALIHF